MTVAVKAYARIHEPVGHVILRINRELVKRAPEHVEFVDSPKEADFQIVQCLGAGSLTKIWNDRYVLVQHNFLNADINSAAVWLGIFQQALMVVSYSDLPSLIGKNAFNFLLTPWGVDKGVFYCLDLPRRNGILTSGWCCEGEAIKECYLASDRCGKHMVNLGDDFHFGKGFSATSRITDRELCMLYNQCEYVSGLRFREGFEMSVVEGMACGCRPVCFDLPVYRNWFHDAACYVPDCRGPELVNCLEALLCRTPEPISRCEQEWVAETFDWKTIANRFWSNLLNSLLSG